MEILNKVEIKQTVSHNLSDIDFKDIMNLYKKCTANLCSFLVTDAALASDNLLHLRKSFDDKIRDAKMQYKIKREAAKISALLLEKMNKHDCLTDEEMIPSDQKIVIEKTKLFSFQKIFRYTKKNNRRSRIKTS